ncbi:MAG: phosphopantetheine-binding protein [Alphaproteobacteria bacterium]|nr:phosphopantetheine-binding protein [Alphaproteobacteria bacterium]
MVFSKNWKKTWELKSLTFDELFNVIVKVIIKQLDEIEEEEVKLESNLRVDFEVDSVDVVAMLLYLEDMFKKASQKTRTVVPTDKLGEVKLVEDIFDIIYEVILEIENKMEPFEKIEPDFKALEKQKKVGELYTNNK